jgi:hypothetical protein
VAAAGAKVAPIVDMPNSPDWPLAVPKPAAPKPAAPVGAGSGAAAAKKRNPPAPIEPAQKWKKVGPALKGLLPPKAKNMVKRQATVVAG